MTAVKTYTLYNGISYLQLHAINKILYAFIYVSYYNNTYNNF